MLIHSSHSAKLSAPRHLVEPLISGERSLKHTAMANHILLDMGFRPVTFLTDVDNV